MLWPVNADFAIPGLNPVDELPCVSLPQSAVGIPKLASESFPEALHIFRGEKINRNITMSLDRCNTTQKVFPHPFKF
ncbi:MAG: hypothetical protein O3C34_11185 [Proteobacteria bacterium]|nr:hypothetical protein [Pseudomonadota bacterium]